VAVRDRQVEDFRLGRLAVAYAQPPRAAAVMVDGGKLQTRLASAGRGVHDPHWREFKAACCLSLSSRLSVSDPQPEPPAKFLDPVQAARLAAEMKARGGGAGRRVPAQGGPAKGWKRRRGKGVGGPVKLVRTVLASTYPSEQFGWQVAAEVHRRGLHLARRKGYICAGQKYNWSIYEMHFVASGFVAILDFLHLLSYLYGAAQAVGGKGSVAAWSLYEGWLRLAWAGRTKELLEGMKAACASLGEAAEGRGEDDPRAVAAEALGYVGNNRQRMDYPRYRQMGLPVSSAFVESTIKQLNRRVKGTEKFWGQGEGAEAILQLRAAHLSEDDTVDRYWSMPRPCRRAAGAGRLNQRR